MFTLTPCWILVRVMLVDLFCSPSVLLFFIFLRLVVSVLLWPTNCNHERKS